MTAQLRRPRPGLRAGRDVTTGCQHRPQAAPRRGAAAGLVRERPGRLPVRSGRQDGDNNHNSNHSSHGSTALGRRQPERRDHT